MLETTRAVRITPKYTKHLEQKIKDVCKLIGVRPINALLNQRITKAMESDK